MTKKTTKGINRSSEALCYHRSYTKEKRRPSKVTLWFWVNKYSGADFCCSLHVLMSMSMSFEPHIRNICLPENSSTVLWAAVFQLLMENGNEMKNEPLGVLSHLIFSACFRMTYLRESYLRSVIRVQILSSYGALSSREPSYLVSRQQRRYLLLSCSPTSPATEYTEGRSFLFPLCRCKMLFKSKWDHLSSLARETVSLLLTSITSEVWYQDLWIQKKGNNLNDCFTSKHV